MRAALTEAFTVNDLLDKIDAALDVIPDPSASTPTTAHELALTFIRAKRRAKACDAEASKMKALATRLIEPIKTEMLAGRWPLSGKVDGANLHRKSELYIAPVKAQAFNGEEYRDHEKLTAAIEQYIAEHPNDPTAWATLLPSKVNNNSLKSTVNGFLTDHEFTDEQKMLPIRDRLLIAGLPEVILDALDVDEGYTVNANGL